MTKSSWQRNASRIGNAAKPDPRTGSRFDDFLKEEGMFEEVQAKALKRALAEQLEESMQAGEADEVGHGKEDGDQPLAARPVLDPSNVSVQLDTLIKAACALGKEIEIKIKRAPKKAAA
jgi:antitoxin HicB